MELPTHSSRPSLALLFSSALPSKPSSRRGVFISAVNKLATSDRTPFLPSFHFKLAQVVSVCLSFKAIFSNLPHNERTQHRFPPPSSLSLSFPRSNCGSRRCRCHGRIFFSVFSAPAGRKGWKPPRSAPNCSTFRRLFCRRHHNCSSPPSIPRSQSVSEANK